MSGRPKAATTVEDRLLSRITRTRHGRWWCWEIDGHLHNGYGHIKVDGVVRKAHRVAYELWVGPIPAGLTIDHLCRHRACVRPEHLEPVTKRENFLRGETWAARSMREGRCAKGHDLTDPKNVYVYLYPGRLHPWHVCRLCRRETDRRRGGRRLRG